MGGHFINVAPVVDDEEGYLYLFGSGLYRQSAVYLARKPLKSLTEPGVFEYCSGLASWSPQSNMAVPIAEENSVGELSARHYKRIGIWLLMYARKGQVVLRAARQPDGPWSQVTKVHSMQDEMFREHYCCGESFCEGERMIHCNKAGVYAPYMLPIIAPPAKNGAITVNYLLSTWDPYGTVLMSTDITISGDAPTR